LIISAGNNLYRENNIGVEFKGKLDYFIHYSHRDIELDYESDINEFGLLNQS